MTLEQFVIDNFAVAVAIVGAVGGAAFTLIMMVYRRGVHVSIMDKRIKDLERQVEQDTKDIRADLKEAIDRGEKEHGEIRKLLQQLIERISHMEGRLDK